MNEQAGPKFDVKFKKLDQTMAWEINKIYKVGGTLPRLRHISYRGPNKISQATIIIPFPTPTIE